MQPDTDFPALDGLKKLVHEQRRLVAGELRIQRERRELEAQMEAMLAAAGVEAVTCEIGLGTFDVRRVIARSGTPYASVRPLKGVE